MTNPFIVARYLLVAFGAFAILSGIGRLAPPAIAASTGAERKLADIESRLQRAEMRISELTSAKKYTRELTAARSGPTRVRAPFEVVGPSGKVLMRVSSNGGDGVIEVNNGAGKVVARMFPSPENHGGSFGAYAADGQGYASIGLGGKSNSGVLILRSADAAREVYVGSGTVATGAYVNLQSNDNLKASLNTSDRHGQLVIMNERGKAVVNATTNPAGQGEVVITAEDQTVRAFIRSLGDDGDACVVRKGQIHCLNIGIPMGGR
jgi:phage-related tail fiber protein